MVSAKAHLFAGVVVAVSGAASAVFVVMVNAWMNTPTGFQVADGRLLAVDPIAGMLNPSTAQQAIHMLLAAYAATGLAVAGLHAFMLLKKPRAEFHRRALAIALIVGAPAAVLQPISGDFSARVVAEQQPVKLAALESHFETTRGAPLHIGGIPDEGTGETRYAIRIPKGLSLLAFHDPDAEVKGLLSFPRDLWPPVLPVHVAFQLMVGLGTAMAVASVWGLFALWRGTFANQRALLRLLTMVTPFGFVATEAGWTVTEVGRQPWVVSGLVKTADAVTPMTGLVYPLALFTVIYIGLAVVIVVVMRSIVRETA
jgi:cytochrome d ubiquinol oxidase subunit I